MALELISSQSNDAKILYLTDNSTWGTDGLPELSEVVSASIQLWKQEPDDDDFVEYDSIVVTSIFTAAAGDSSLLIFPFEFNTTPGLNYSPAGINVFPDGIWKVQYTITDSSESYEFASPAEIMFDQIIKFKIYKDLSQIPLKYLSANNYYTKPMDDVLLEKCLHYSMEASAYVAKQDEILETLDTLQRLTQ
jgi:hypothetical protein